MSSLLSVKASSYHIQHHQCHQNVFAVKCRVFCQSRLHHITSNTINAIKMSLQSNVESFVSQGFIISHPTPSMPSKCLCSQMLSLLSMHIVMSVYSHIQYKTNWSNS